MNPRWAPTRRYSKSSEFYASIKRDFFESNEDLLAQAKAENELYMRQPLRQACKLCAHRLASYPDFVSHEVSYALCANCGHFNGRFEDTAAFVSSMYLADGGKANARNYIDAAFTTRAEAIYRPKLDFLCESLPKGSPPRILDVGCGSGYFVYSCLASGLESTGVDFSRETVEFGNDQIHHLLGLHPLTCAGDEAALFDTIASSRASVLSAIGVIEHLRELNRFFEAFQSSAIEIMFFSVPMFSASAIFESIFTTAYPRQLSGSHTHLFTEKSILWLYENRGLRPIAEWRFGTDVMDLHRFVTIVLNRRGVSRPVIALWEEGFARKIDDLQAVLDRNEFCDEIHCVVTKSG